MKAIRSEKKIILENDGSTTNEDRLGAIGDIRLAIERQKIRDDIIVVAGDNMFDWGLKDFADFAKKKPDTFAIGAYDIGDRKKANIYGVVETDGNGSITNFLEKPDDPPSSLIATGIYYFPKGKLGLMDEFIKVGNENDAPGHFIQWLRKEHEVRCYVFRGVWYDIGDIDSYRRANLSFQEK